MMVAAVVVVMMMLLIIMMTMHRKAAQEKNSGVAQAASSGVKYRRDQAQVGFGERCLQFDGASKKQGLRAKKVGSAGQALPVQQAQLLFFPGELLLWYPIPGQRVSCGTSSCCNSQGGVDGHRRMGQEDLQQSRWNRLSEMTGWFFSKSQRKERKREEKKGEANKKSATTRKFNVRLPKTLVSESSGEDPVWIMN